MTKKTLPQRIREAYNAGHRDYHSLLEAVFPLEQYPNAWRGARHGGPPGCAISFNAALRKMGAHITYGKNRQKSKILLPGHKDDE